MSDPRISPPGAPHLAAVPPPIESTTDAGDADGRARPLNEHEQTAVAVVTAMVAALGLLGFVNSFTRVNHAAQPTFGWLSFTVPIGIDLGIAIFSALDIVLARLNMRIRWLRLIPWTLTAATVYLNVGDYLNPPDGRKTDWFAVIAHAVLPCLWVAAVEVGAYVVRARAGLAAGTRMDSIRFARWVLAPLPTIRLWRRMVLWELRSYTDALTRERARVLTLTDLKDAHGAIAWRWKAPRRVKAMYKLGELTPAVEQPALSATPDRPALEAPEPSAAPERTKQRTTNASRRGRSTGRKPAQSRTTNRTVPDIDDLKAVGRTLAAELQTRGVSLTRDNLAAALREAGQTAENARVGALVAWLKSNPEPVEGDQ